MGNRTSSSSKSVALANLVDSLGRLRLVPLPITVAELMLDNPGFALSSIDDIRRTHRLSPMRADDPLAPRKLYLLVPLPKLNSRLSDPQLAAIRSLSNNIMMKKKVTPPAAADFDVSPLSVDVDVDATPIPHKSVNSDDFSGELGRNFRLQRQRFGKPTAWTPALHPILEES